MDSPFTFTITGNHVAVIRLHKTAYKHAIPDLQDMLWDAVASANVETIEIEGGKRIKSEDMERIKSHLQRNILAMDIAKHNGRILNWDTRQIYGHFREIR
jgi:hypothetical protein